MSYFEQEISSLKLPKPDASTQGAKIYNSAQEYLYNAFKEKNSGDSSAVLVLNDDAGVLCALLAKNGVKVIAVHDSLIAKDSYQQIAYQNQIEKSSVNYMSTQEFYDSEPLGVHSVLMNIPAHLEYFKEQLNLIRKHVDANPVLLSSGMVKHISPNAKDIIQKVWGGTKASRVVKKAILFQTTPNPKLISSSVSERSTNDVDLKEYGCYKTYPGVFSAQKLDQGTRLLLENVPTDLSGVGVDLGCGYGVISKVVLEKCNAVQKLFATDISSAAVESTKISVSGVEVIQCQGLQHSSLKNLNFVLSNPPFHTQSQLDVKMMHRLINDVYDALDVNGVFVMVGNKGMKHGQFLHKVFKNVDRIAANNKYEVYKCTKENK